MKNTDAEQARIRAAREWHKAIDTIPDPVAIIAPNYSIEKANRAYAEFVGADDAALPGMKCFNLVHGCDNPPPVCPLSKTLADHQAHRAEVYEPRVDKYFHISTTPLFDDNGTFTGAVHVVHDINTLKATEEKLRKSEERYRTLFSRASDGITIFSIDGKLLEVNESFARMHGYTQQEMLQMRLQDLDTPELLELAPERLSRILAGETLMFEVEHYHKDGHIFPLEVSASAINCDGETSIQCFHRDISERKRIEEELLTARAAADAANRAKSAFLANMSHEIRTPMNGMLGMLQLLRLTSLTEDQEEYMGNVETCANNLLAIINDILDLSKIEAGKIELETTSFSLQQCIQDVILLQKHLAFEKGVRINAHLPDDLPPLVCGDQLRLKQILLNLLNNAVKFTEKGEITIAAALLERSADQVIVHLTVRDTGIGMSPEILSKVFDPFTQADAGIPRKFGGSGLGLTICRQLALLMGGCIRAESEEGKGSRFTLELPCDLPAQAVKTTAAEKFAESTPALHTPLAILVAEDNPLNQRVAVKLLQKLGHHVLAADNGQQALNIWRQGGIDLILMDIQMPVMDGFEVLHIIRAEEAVTEQQTPVIALTAQTLDNAKEKMLKAGFDFYLAKPFTIELLQEIIRKVQQAQVTTTPPAPSADAAPSASYGT